MPYYRGAQAVVPTACDQRNARSVDKNGMVSNRNHSERLDQACWAAAEHLGFAAICCVILLGALSLAVQMQREMMARELVHAPNSQWIDLTPLSRGTSTSSEVVH
jgi:hypothetical protein